MSSGAERAAEFILTRIASRDGKRARQARRETPLPCDSDAAALRMFAEHHVARVRELEARSLVAWAARPEMAVLIAARAEVTELVEWQASGRRCVALLENAAREEALEFALHDLRHLGKFFDPAHHRAQRGFFAHVSRALRSEAWIRLDHSLDAKWRADRDSVLADMNGSPVFLCSVLKMKLKMAARRRHAASSHSLPPERGALDGLELREFERLFELWLAGLRLPPEVETAARGISCRRDALSHAATFVAHFEAHAC